MAKTSSSYAIPNEFETSNDYWLELDRKARLQSRATHPVCLSHGQGVRLWDVEGKEYLDFESGQVCASVGHSHPKLVKAIQTQATRLIQTGSCYTEPTQITFQNRLAETTSGEFGLSFLACSGSEANEAAMRLAKAYTGRHEIITFTGNYLGQTYGSWSVSGFGGKAREPYGPAMVGVLMLPTPFDYCIPEEKRFAWRDDAVIDACLRHCEQMIDAATSGKPAAVMVELLQSAGGVRLLPARFVDGIRRICDERGSLMIVDEAQTGVGRLGKWWGYEHYDSRPDIVVASKTLGGGAPLSAVLTGKKIADGALARGYRQSSSHTGDPLLAAAGLATLEVIEEENLLQNVTEMGQYLKDRLEALGRESAVIGEIRGIGLLNGIEFVRSERGESNEEATELFSDECRQRGLLTGWWKVPYLAPNIVRLMPPYTVTREEIDDALGIIKAALDAVGTMGASR